MLNGKFFRRSAGLASAALLSLAASPALANHDWDWGRHRHRDRVDAGDILAGVLIIGTIAAVASAASKANKNKVPPEYRYPDQRYPEQSYPGRDNSRDYGRDDRPEWSEGGNGGINSAVNRCIGEVERGTEKVDEVDSVNRDGDGWRVQGRMAGGSGFACSLDRNGRIRSISIDGHAI